MIVAIESSPYMSETELNESKLINIAMLWYRVNTVFCFRLKSDVFCICLLLLGICRHIQAVWYPACRVSRSSSIFFPSV